MEKKKNSAEKNDKKNEGGGECWIMKQIVLLDLNKKDN